MTDKEVCRYIDLADRKVFIIAHSGVEWKPEYAAELEAIDRELAELRKKVDQEHRRRKEGRRKEEGMKEYRVRFWREDGSEDFLEFDSMEQAQAFYDGRDSVAEVQRYIEGRHTYETIVAPTYEF